MYPYVRGELRTGLCGSCMEAAAVTIAVDREAADGSRARRRQGKVRPARAYCMSESRRIMLLMAL